MGIGADVRITGARARQNDRERDPCCRRQAKATSDTAQAEYCEARDELVVDWCGGGYRRGRGRVALPSHCTARVAVVHRSGPDKHLHARRWERDQARAEQSTGCVGRGAPQRDPHWNRILGDSMRLVVVEGHVALAAEGRKVDVFGGAMAAVAPGAPPSDPVEVDVWELLHWQNGLLIYRDTPLEQVAAEVGAHFGARFSIADTTLIRRRVTAWFNNEPFEDVVATICQVVDANCTTGDTVEMVR